MAESEIVTDSTPSNSLLGASTVNTGNICGPQRRLQTLAAARAAYTAYMRGLLQGSQLTHVICFNILDALSRNADCLRLSADWLTCDAISSFNKQGPSVASAVESSCPANLKPIQLQMRVRHHPWVDLFPSPRMRHNFLAKVLRDGPESFDEDDLCSDIWEAGKGRGIEEAALLVWGDASDPRNWEATEPFLHKWGWLVKGCIDLLRATNYWRERRDERPLNLSELE